MIPAAGIEGIEFIPCEVCGGTGYASDDTCPSCDGTGESSGVDSISHGDLRQALADALQLADDALRYMLPKFVGKWRMREEYERLSAILDASIPAPALVDGDSSLES